MPTAKSQPKRPFAERLEKKQRRCESCTKMSATIVRAKRQTTLPEDVCQTAGIRIRDRVDWRFEGGEIRGRKLVPVQQKVRVVRPVWFKGLLIAPQNLEIDLKQLDEDLRRDREERESLTKDKFC
jgi:hypothetical protein